ncbi:MAG: hypothetical protein JWO56_3665, partial [Acidobacteria bacterium]|nr:hypothetical protein [Acidobacteriota bacterium]
MVAVFLAALSALPLAAQNAYEVKSGMTASAMAPLGGTLYFSGSDETTTGLWKTDGPAAGTQLVTTFTGPVAALTPCNGQMMVLVNANSGLSLWRSDGTAGGTILIKQAFDYFPSADLFPSACVGRNFFFAATGAEADGGYTNMDLWKTDGTTANTLLVARKNGFIATMTNVRGRLYFTTGDLFSAPQLWKSDGTAAGTTLVFNRNDRVNGSVAIGGLLYFDTGVSGDAALWRTDGSAAGTVKLSTGTSIYPAAGLAGTAYFFRDGLWRSDGTAAGTTAVRWPMTTNTLIRQGFAVSSGRVFLRGADPGMAQEALWKSDGTAGGTAQFAPAYDAVKLTDADGSLLYGTNSATWITNGTAAPVSILAKPPLAIVKGGTRAYIISDAAPRSLSAYDLAFAAASLAPAVVSMSGGTPVTIAGIGFGAGTTVTVDGAAVAASITPASLTFNAPAHAQGTVDVVVTSAAGQQARMRGALSFACDTTPVAVAGGSTTTCASTPVPLSGSGGVACSWLPATGLSDSTSCTPMATPATTTTYRLTVTNASGCASTNAADVTVLVNPLADTRVFTGQASTFGGQSSAAVANAGAGASYHWTITNGQIVDDPNQSLIHYVTGCDNARLDVTVTRASGCPATGTLTVSPQYPRSVTEVSPRWGAAGTPLTLTGTQLDCVTAIRFGLRLISTSFQIVNNGLIATTFPAGADSGRIDVLINGEWVLGGTNATFTRVVLPKRGDMDGDGKPDLLFRNPGTGVDAVWVMNGTAFGSIANIASFANADYHIAGMANFDGDGSNDLLLHNRATGANAIWLMKGLVYSGVTNLPGIPDPNFDLAGTGDFNGDGKPDILIRNQVTGANALWLMDGTAVQSTVNLPGLANSGYRICGSGDFNGDGKADIVWRNASTGANAVWLMNGTAFDSVLNLPALANSAYAIGAISDYNGDGKPDIVWRNASTGANALWLMDGATQIGTVNLPPVMIPEMEMAGPR